MILSRMHRRPWWSMRRREQYPPKAKKEKKEEETKPRDSCISIKILPVRCVLDHPLKRLALLRQYASRDARSCLHGGGVDCTGRVYRSLGRRGKMIVGRPKHLGLPKIRLSSVSLQSNLFWIIHHVGHLASIAVTVVAPLPVAKECCCTPRL